MKKSALILLLLVLGLNSCGEYQQILKSRDPEFKYQKALMYFNEQEYVKAQTLLEDISAYYKGTERSEDIIAYLARTYIGQKDYTSATTYYEAYLRNYPKGKYAIEARYQVGHCQYLDSPDAKLDQAITRKAIDALTQFVDMYPDNPYSEKAYSEIAELYDKLALKEYNNAKLYYNLGSYLGNNYLSCEIVARNALKDYPSNAYQEDLSWLILQAKYQQTINSYEDKKMERARETQDEYYNFITDYPQSKHRSAADKILKDIKKITKE